MKKRRLFAILFLIFLLFVISKEAFSAGGDFELSPFDRLVQRYGQDSDFKFFANISIVVTILAVLLSLCAAYFGIEQVVLWSFIGGFVGVNAIELLLNQRMGIGFGPFSYITSFGIGIGCAIYTQTKGPRY